MGVNVGETATIYGEGVEKMNVNGRNWLDKENEEIGSKRIYWRGMTFVVVCDDMEIW